jgi:CubicO group peptidase (beta-lactamase class C family)
MVTTEDMLSHRTGVAAHDWAWTFNTNFPQEVYLRRLKYFEPFAPLRKEFQYNNFMFFALSALLGKLYNTTWNDLVTKKLFQPLEMKNTFGSYIWINGGAYKGTQVIPSDFVRRAIESHFVADGALDTKFPDEQFYNIGFCWFLSSYRGHYQVQHTGNIDGFSSSVTFFPTDSVGIVVLANQNSSGLIHLVPDFVPILYSIFLFVIRTLRLLKGEKNMTAASRSSQR